MTYCDEPHAWPIRTCRTVLLMAIIASAVAVWPQPADAHIFISRSYRAGAFPPYDGGGWIGEAYLDVPVYDLVHYALLHRCLTGPEGARAAECRAGDIDNDGDVDLRDTAKFQIAFHNPHLIRTERLIDDRDPDITFHTDWIDFPAGPRDSGLDSSFETVGDFLNDYIENVSDPSKLDEPFSSLYLRFSGFVKIRFSDETRVRDLIGLPVWIDVGTMGYDAYRVRVGVEIYRAMNTRWSDPFFNFGPAVEVLGMFPIEITYLNIYDPESQTGNHRAGLEIYSWHGGGKPWPAGNNMVHEVWGPATLMPPRVVYQEEDVRPVAPGDFDADFDLDLRDYRWYQYCSDPSFFFLPSSCKIFDFDADGRVDGGDYSVFRQNLRGPDVPSDGSAAP